MSCSCNSNPCSCGQSVCSPANVIFQRVCTDPGVINAGANLIVGDSNFCQRRLAPSPGFVVTNSTPTGYEVTSTTEPNVNLSTFGISSGSTVGVLLTRNTDGIIRTLLPAAVANLILMTNAVGQFVLQPVPAATIPANLAVTTITATDATFASLTVSGPMVKFTGLASGTIASTIGLDGSGNLVIGSASATGVQGAMFYESASSPGPGTPNFGASNGSLLIIGNQLYDSGGSLIGVTNTTTLKVLVAGKYKLDWCGMVSWSGGTGTPSLGLLINGVLVNTGNTRPSVVSSTLRTDTPSGFEFRDLSVNDTIQLQLLAPSTVSTHVYEVRVGFEKFA